MGISYNFWFTNKHVDTLKIVFCLTAWDPPKVASHLFLERTSWKQRSPDRGAWRPGPDVLKVTKTICCVERAATPCSDQSCHQSVQHLPASSQIYVCATLASLSPKKKVNISKMRQNVVRDEEIKVHLLWLGSGQDMGQKIAFSNCKLEYRFSIEALKTNCINKTVVNLCWCEVQV